jgi:nucleoside-diphosphate-sugar epimerase
MTSSVTVYRRDAGDSRITDTTLVDPATVYGLTKSISEQMTAAYRLAKAVDGRCARLATVVVRPKKIGVSAGASISDVLRDISLGRPCQILVDWHVKSAVIDYESCVKGLVRLHDVDSAALGHIPSVNFPSISASIADMVEAAQAAARHAHKRPGTIETTKNEFVQNTVESWPTVVDDSRAERLGITCKKNLEQVCSDFIVDYENFWQHRVG